MNSYTKHRVLIVSLFVLSIPSLVCSEESLKKKYNLEFLAVPMVTVNPNFGNGGGATAMALFDIGPKEDNLQSSSIGVTGLYSDRGSHAAVIAATLLPDRDWRFKTAIANVGVKSELNIDQLPEQAVLYNKSKRSDAGGAIQGNR